jgi:aryl-alcohol dehydrogenase-like predicted oxidoreductase
MLILTVDAYGIGTAEVIIGRVPKGFDRDSSVVGTRGYYHWYEDDFQERGC